jgi:two-component system sensor histidine kinase QseC
VETAGLGAALNDLLQRQALALERERRFTADAAHELRTPLAAMRAQAQVAARAGSWPEAKAAQQKLIAGVDRATRLVSQLLTLARLEPGESLGSIEIVRVDDVVAEVVEDLQAAATSGQIEILVHSAPVRVGGHTDAIYVMLRNLVENAVQHTPAGASVEIRCDMLDGVAELQVADRGPGVPAEERSKIFDRFYRLPGEPVDGSGLGLSIVRRVAQVHHASIDLSSGLDGRGLTVRVRFPAEPI